MDSSFICLRCSRAIRTARIKLPSARALSTTATQRARTPPASNTSSLYESSQTLPRWQQTPPAMKMPIRVRPLPKQPEWKVNDDPEVLDQALDNFIGRAGEAAREQLGLDGSKMLRGRDLLPEEIKWLAVTHKSFDHARRGFNDRLAFLGKRIVDFQTSLALLNAPAPPTPQPPAEEVYRHPALEGLENVTVLARHTVLDKSRLANLATSYGLQKVARWKPKKSDNLQGSGVEVVLAHTMYSIIGALALQRGGEVAANVTKERILKPLGLR